MSNKIINDRKFEIVLDIIDPHCKEDYSDIPSFSLRRGGTIHHVYVTSNTKNEMKYIGKHSSYKHKDSYLGSGTSFNAIAKSIGYEHFFVSHRILSSSLVEAYALEQYIVSRDLISTGQLFNTSEGGPLENRVTEREAYEIHIKYNQIKAECEHSEHTFLGVPLSSKYMNRIVEFTIDDWLDF